MDTALQLLERAGDFVSDDIWHRVVQLVTNNESMQQYAARNLVEVLRRGANHEVGAREAQRGRGGRKEGRRAQKPSLVLFLRLRLAKRRVLRRVSMALSSSGSISSPGFMK